MPFTRVACTPSDGLKNTSTYPTTPASETAARKQIQDTIDQVVSGVNTLETELESTAASAKIGCTGSYSNIQAFITATELAGSGTTPGAGVITDNMMSSDVKIGSLASLTTTIKTSVVNAINEVVTNIGNLTLLATTAKDSIVNAINEIVNSDVGKIEYFAMSTPPSGRLSADGSAVSRTTYARLFAKIGTTYGVGDGSTTFNLPDMRGVFPRGWDNGKGYDTGRTFGSYQADGNKSHTHTNSTSTGGSHTHTIGNGDYSVLLKKNSDYSGGLWGTGITGYTTNVTDSGGSHNHTVTINADGNTEVTVKNIALLACIKY